MLAQVGAQVGSKLVQVEPKISSGRFQEALLKGPGRVLGGSREGPGRHLEPRGPAGGARGAKMVSRWFQKQSKTDIKCLRSLRSETFGVNFWIDFGAMLGSL